MIGQVAITLLMVLGRQIPGGSFEATVGSILILTTIFTTIMTGI